MSYRHLRTSAVALACGLLLLVAGCGDEDPAALDAQMGPSAASPTPQLDPLAGAPTEGLCYKLNQNQAQAPTSSKKPVTDCYYKHNTYTYRVGLFPKGTTSSDTDRVQKQCQNHLAKVTGLSQDELFGTYLEWIWFEPTTAQWSAGARWFRCDLVAKVDGKLKPLPETAYLDTEFSDGVPDKYARCINPGADADGDGSEDANYVTCDKPHQFRFAGSFTPPGKKYPGEDRLKQMTDDRCHGITGTNTWWATWPLKHYWEQGHRRLSCYKQTTS